MAIQLSPRMDIKSWLRDKELAKNVIFLKRNLQMYLLLSECILLRKVVLLLGLEETRLPQQEASGQPQSPEPCILVLE